ncbi:HNH endonuclease [Bradyrhizobium macuxiense]|uniref:HNH endonuclease n=1 Tax=Bradyrhizobium macuxiense TaxID=1755647 RepID=UPI0013652E67|nr:HNH endonuclease [Bradyrhizobium macuxiense]
MTELTAERLREVLTYSPRSGLFRNRVNRQGGRNKNKNRAGDVVGAMNDQGYRIITIDYRKYRAHHLVWLYVYGRWPTDQIDHIRGIGRLDQDRLENLREASQSENMCNLQGLRVDNSSGFVGVNLHTCGKYQAYVTLNGHRHYLGLFDTAEEASAVRNAEAQRLHGAFYNDGTRQ